MRIRYVGDFAMEVPGVGVVQPGQEFEAEGETAEGLLARSVYFVPADSTAQAKDEED